MEILKKLVNKRWRLESREREREMKSKSKEVVERMTGVAVISVGRVWGTSQRSYYLKMDGEIYQTPIVGSVCNKTKPSLTTNTSLSLSVFPPSIQRFSFSLATSCFVLYPRPQQTTRHLFFRLKITVGEVKFEQPPTRYRIISPFL